MKVERADALVLLIMIVLILWFLYYESANHCNRKCSSFRKFNEKLECYKACNAKED